MDENKSHVNYFMRLGCQLLLNTVSLENDKNETVGCGVACSFFRDLLKMLLPKQKGGER